MSRIFNIVKPVLTLGFLATAVGVHAHEFWIQPHDYRLAPQERLVADVRVGMDFGGNPLAYLPDTINAFNITDTNGTRKVEGRIGDIPSVNITPVADGLQIINLFTTSSTITWHDFQDFDEFVNLHGMSWVLPRHNERGLPDVGFKEAYTRFVKNASGGGRRRGARPFYRHVL